MRIIFAFLLSMTTFFNIDCINCVTCIRYYRLYYQQLQTI